MSALTLDRARTHIGAGVVYTPGHGRCEDGIIIDVRDPWVLVRYTGDQHAKATAPEHLTLLTAGSALQQLRTEYACTACAGAGCDACDHTGQQTCEHRTGPAEHCEQPRPCPVHDRALIEEATL